MLATLLIFTLSLSTELQLCFLLPRERPPHQEECPAASESSQTRLTTSQISFLLFFTHVTFLFSNLSSLCLSHLTSRPFSPFFPFAAPSLAALPSLSAALWGKPSPLNAAAGTQQRSWWLHVLPCNSHLAGSAAILQAHSNSLSVSEWAQTKKLSGPQQKPMRSLQQ